jgi:hypothetical protein
MGKKTVILNPTAEQKNGTEVITFGEGVIDPFSKFELTFLGDIFVGYPCLDGNWSCSTNDVPHDNLRQDGIDVLA